VTDLADDVDQKGDDEVLLRLANPRVQKPLRKDAADELTMPD
jgi:hypothetical protein